MVRVFKRELNASFFDAKGLFRNQAGERVTMTHDHAHVLTGHHTPACEVVGLLVVRCRAQNVRCD